MDKIFVADDDLDMCLLLKKFLNKHGFEVDTANSGKATLDWLKKNKTSLILCDFRLEDMTGVDILSKIKLIQPDVPVIIVTGYSDVKDAVEVMKLGAYDYITKPLFPDEILLTIKKALFEHSAININTKTNSHTKPKEYSTKIENEKYLVGDSLEFANLMKQIALVAPTNYSIIIYGESGSGKEVIAQQIHQKSKRADKPFVAIDCGALSKELAASELFGHEKGAFTGASSQKTGSLELANTGTIFLDEICNLSYDIQVSLLRVIQERKIRRVGGIKDIDLDLRIIVASNEKLWDATRSGKFREDLYHRFNEFSIEVPSLRERKKDILNFANHFLKLTNQELGKDVKGFTDEVEEIFLNYVWYGNLRELKNVIKRATLLTDGNFIEAKSLPFEINNFNKLQFDKPFAANNVEEDFRYHSHEMNKENKLKAADLEAEYSVIIDALKKYNYNKSKAAQFLNIDRKTLYNKLNLFKGHKDNK